MKNQETCILIVDDDKRMRRVLSDYLKSMNYSILEGENGADGLIVYEKHKKDIDLIILDIMMPLVNGYEFLSTLREDSLVPIIMVTARESESDQLEGFKLGVDDYITKPFSSSLLSARIEAVLRRSKTRISSVLTAGNLSVYLDKIIACVNGQELSLTHKEFDLLLYMVQHPDLPLSRDQLLNAVWSIDYDGDGRTIDTHIKQLRSKLKVADGKIETVFGVGYRWVVPS